MIRTEQIEIEPKKRGFHIITEEVLSALEPLPDIGILQLFLQHTSAGLTINEAADPDVLLDFESFFNKIVPEHQSFLKHTIEGPDDMPAHIKASLVGSSVVLPIQYGRLALGTWQGIYLCEFRNHGGPRQLLATILT